MAIYDLPELLPNDIIERARKLSSALLADGMKGMGIEMEGCMDATILPISPFLKMIGTALTVETDNGDNFPIHVATYSGGEGYVMVVDGKNYTQAAYLGGLIVSAAKAVGFQGIVCDGLVRDREDCTELGFPLFSRGFIQRGPIKKDPGVVNGTVRCGGISVNPGDLVVGDCDGVTVVPRELIPQVLEKAEAKLDYETKRQKSIEAYIAAKKEGKPLPELAPQWVLDML